MTRRLMKFVGRRDGRDVYVTTLCPPGGTRRPIKDTGLVVAGRRVFVFAECRVGRLDESPENCYGWDGTYVNVACRADPVPETLVATFTSPDNVFGGCPLTWDDGVRYAVPLHYRDDLPVDYDGHTLPGWFGTIEIINNNPSIFGIPTGPWKLGIALVCHGLDWKLLACPAVDPTVQAWCTLGDNIPPPFESFAVYGNLSHYEDPFELVQDGALFVCSEFIDNTPGPFAHNWQCGCVRITGGVVDKSAPGNPSDRIVINTPWEFPGPGIDLRRDGSGSGSGSGGPCFDPDLGPATQFPDRAMMKRVGFRAGRWVFAKACCPVEEGVGGGGFVQTICCPNPLRETLHAVVTSGHGSPCGMRGETIEMNYNPLDDQWQGTSAIGIIIRMFCEATAQPFRVIVTDGAGNTAEGTAVLTSCDPPQFDCTDLAASIGSPTCVSPDTTIQFLE